VKDIGPQLFATTADGRLQSSIGTLFPRHELLITAPPLHALQREAFKDWFREAPLAAGQQPPNDLKLDWEAAESVDLIFAPGGLVLIRPELERLDLAFDADEKLQTEWRVPRHRIRFLSVRDPRVRQALRERGELWRISAPPSEQEQIGEAIAHSRVAIREGALYYYNPHTGTRFVTCAEFARLAQLDDQSLARQLDEIAQHCIKRNRHGNPEVTFFGVDALRFGGPNFVGQKFLDLPAQELRSRHEALSGQFREATEPDLREDNAQDRAWQLRMFGAIATEQREELASENLQALGSEFAPRIRWLPGGSYEEGEFFFVPLAGPESELKDPELKALGDPLARGFITNFIREYGNLEYLNLGRIEPAPGLGPRGGRRGVYLAEIKVRGESNPRVLFLRVQRWGIRERLEEKDEAGRPKDLLRAIFETEEYVDYTLDRRLGCLQFGMHLPVRVNMRRVTEIYAGTRAGFAGHFFPVIYFERDYLPGIPTNKLPERKLAETRYALALARLLGKAAAANIVVGRSLDPLSRDVPGQTLFDDGNEIIMEGSDGLPRELVLVDHSGAFADWRTPSLLPFAKSYAAPVNRRTDKVPDPKLFAKTYLTALRDEFQRLQSDYRRRRGAFDGLFKHLPCNEQGSFACRWNHVLQRLRETDLDILMREVLKYIAVLKQADPG
jgi:hypothetical protein